MRSGAFGPFVTSSRIFCLPTSAKVKVLPSSSLFFLIQPSSCDVCAEMKGSIIDQYVFRNLLSRRVRLPPHRPPCFLAPIHQHYAWILLFLSPHVWQRTWKRSGSQWRSSPHAGLCVPIPPPCPRRCEHASCYPELFCLITNRYLVRPQCGCGMCSSTKAARPCFWSASPS